MRIAVYVTAFPVLSETFVLNQITGLIDRGHDVEIVALRAGDAGLAHPDVQRYGLLERLRLRGDGYAFMPRARPARIAAAWLLWRAATVAERRVLRRALDPVRFGKEALTLALYFRAARALREDAGVDVAHCHFGQHGEAVARLRAIGAIDAQVVTTYHGEDLSRRRFRGRGEPFAHLFAHGRLHLPVSDLWRRELIRRGCPPARTLVHRMGVDVELLRASDVRVCAAERPFTVLSVARFVEKKGLQYAIEGFAQFALAAGTSGAARDVRYRLLGSGPLACELEQRIAAAGLSHVIELLPPADAAGVRAELHAADAFLLPSVTAADGDREGVPVVLMEAMASGLPVVSTWHSGIPELVHDGSDGLLVPERNAAAIAEALTRLMGAPELAASLGRAARATAEREFAIERLNDVLERRLLMCIGAQDEAA